ncbi:MAG: TolC family protein [Prevotella sp.]|nr:TolC family protein [Prevotella sp.]
MKRRKRFIGLMAAILLLTGSPIHGQTAKKWSLDDCIEYALTHNISLKKKNVARQQAEEDWKQSKADLLPSLSASTSQSMGYRPWVNSGVSTVANGTVTSSMKKSYYNGSYGINASWTLWNGNQNTNTVHLNKLNAQTAELDSAVTANSIQEQILKLYLQILYLNDAVAVNQNNLATSRKNEERGQELVNVGKMSKADLAQLSAQTAQDEYNVVNAQSILANYKLQLKQLLELTGDMDFDIAVPEHLEQEAMKEIPSLQSTYEAALTSRPEIEQQRLAAKSSALNLSIAKAGYLPTVSLSGSLGTSSSSMSDKTWGQQMKTNFDAMAGVSFSVPLYDRRKTKTAVNKARLQIIDSELSMQEQEKQLYSTIEGYWLDALTNQQKYKAASASVSSEEASCELLSEQFRLGLKNIIELMNGKDKLLEAQQNMLESKYLTIMNIKLLEFYGKQE